MNIDLKRYKRDCLLGALGALLMLVGDLCLSVIPASPGDSGLFVREAYLNGSYETWRLPLLLATGLCGMALGFFTVRAMTAQVLPEYRKTRRAILIGGVIYVSSAAALHFLIGSLADWTSRLSPLLGRDETVAVVQAQYSAVSGPMLIAYAGILLLLVGTGYAVLAKKTVLPRWMILFHPIVWELPLVLIPDIRQLLGAQIGTFDFVMSQGSGNFALFVWMAANAIWGSKNERKN